MSSEKRIIVDSRRSDFRYAMFDRLSLTDPGQVQPVVEEYTLPLRKHAVGFTFRPEAEDDALFMVSLRRAMLASLERHLGWPATQVRWDRVPVYLERKPRWWQILRRLGLRAKEYDILTRIIAEVRGELVPGVGIVEVAL